MKGRQWQRAHDAHQGERCRGWCEGRCAGFPLQLAHVLPRKFDLEVEVHPLAVIPLCVLHHDRADGRAHPPLDVMALLTDEEKAFAFGRLGEGEATAWISGRAERAAA